MNLRIITALLCLLPGLLLSQEPAGHEGHDHGLPKGPVLGVIDFYGLRKVSEEEVRKVIGVAEGGNLPRSKSDTELAIEELPNVVLSRLQAVCCEDGKAILYIGVEERGAPHYNYRLPPSDPVLLPDEIHQNYVLFLSALNQAVRDGDTAEDLTKGHSLMQNMTVRSHQEKFPALADAHLGVVRDVLRNSLNAEHRAIAAYVIGYSSDKTAVVDDLLYALRDSDDTVRSNSMRALAAIEVLAKLQPSLEIDIPPTWLVEMLNSLIWTDKTAAAVNLVNLTEHRNEAVLTQLRERALEALLDMARWRHLPHALPAYILLGRILGLEEEEIQAAWGSDDRLQLVEKAEALRRKSG